MLPTEKELSALPFKVTIWNRMANKVGGDFYSTHKVSDNFYIVGCFDVSGKNVAAALLTVLVSAFFSMMQYTEPETFSSADNITAKFDKYLATVVPVGNFITGALCYIDTKNNKVKIQNCGHTRIYDFLPIEKDNAKKIGISHIDASLPPFGMGEVAKDFFINQYSQNTPEIKKHIQETVEHWVHKAPLADDITVMDIRFI